MPEIATEDNCACAKWGHIQIHTPAYTDKHMHMQIPTVQDTWLMTNPRTWLPFVFGPAFACEVGQSIGLMITVVRV